MLPEFRRRLQRDFEVLVPSRLAGFSKVVAKRVDGAPTYQTSSAFAGGLLTIRLGFYASNRFAISLHHRRDGESGPAKPVPVFDKPANIKSGAFWADVDILPSMQELDDDFWMPVRPSSAQIARKLREAPPSDKRQRAFSHIFDEDGQVASLLATAEPLPAVLAAIDDFFEYEPNPWREIAKWGEVGPADIDFAVGGKIGLVIDRLAKDGLKEFRSLVD